MSKDTETGYNTRSQTSITSYTTKLSKGKDNQTMATRLIAPESNFWDSRDDYLLDIKSVLKEVVKAEIANKLDDFSTSLDSINKDIDDIKSEQSNRKQLVDKKIEKLEKEIVSHKIEKEKMGKRLSILERKETSLNLKLLNVLEKNNDNITEEQNVSEAFVFAGIKLASNSIVSAKRIGTYSRVRPRSLILTVQHKTQKDFLLGFEQKQQLKKRCSIIILEDLPQEVEKNRRILYRIYKEAKPHHKARLYDEYLVINGRKFTTENLHSLPEDLKLHEMATKYLDNVVAFYTSFSHFSNHHPCKFTIEETEFNCVEQYFMYKKASFFDDKENADMIMASEDPVEQKNFGKDIRNFRQDMWNEVQEKFMENGVRAKFVQNAYLRESLINTGNKLLIEANPFDKFWSSGLKITDKEIHDSRKHTGKNILGKILVTIREEF